MNDQMKNKSKLTRSQYRQQRESEVKAFQERDRKRIQVEKEYARTHQKTPSRSETLEKRASTEEKVTNLKRRLNWLILDLIIGIIIVFLILFFVD